MACEYDVTVLIASFNAKWEELCKTVLSAIYQEKINLEIVIADDASNNNYFSELKALFEANNFYHYQLISSNKNNGTCINEYNGVKNSSGEYIKSISPGDYLFDYNTLAEWYLFMKDKKSTVSFGDAVYYEESDGQIKVVSRSRSPQNVNIYKKRGNNKIKYMNYIMLDDVVLGVNFLVKRDIYIQYLERIIGKIKYAEDMVYCLMIVDHIDFDYFEKNVVWYECCSGVSNTGGKWKEILGYEKKIAHEIVATQNHENNFDKLRLYFVAKYILKTKIDFLKYIIYPELIIQKILKEKIKTKTRIEIKQDFLDSLHSLEINNASD